jgi:hypothetical protein
MGWWVEWVWADRVVRCWAEMESCFHIVLAVEEANEE